MLQSAELASHVPGNYEVDPEVVVRGVDEDREILLVAIRSFPKCHLPHSFANAMKRIIMTLDDILCLINTEED